MQKEKKMKKDEKMSDEKMKKIFENLPEGCIVTERPASADLLLRGKGKYIAYVDALKILPATRTLQLTIDGLSKNKITGFKVALRATAKELNYLKRINFLQQGNLLLLW